MRERKDPYTNLLEIARKQREIKLRVKKLESETEEIKPPDVVQQLEKANKTIQEQSELVSQLLDNGTGLDAELLEIDDLLAQNDRLSQSGSKNSTYMWIAGAFVLGLFLGWTGMIQLGI